MASSILVMVLGLALLLIAADRLVVAVVRLSRGIGVSAVLVGAVVVGLGTSIPELLVSGIAAATDNIDVAMANVVGSNITNVTLVLGAATLIAPVATNLKTLNREGVLMLASVAAILAVLIDHEVSRWEGALLLVGLVVALVLLVRWSMADSAEEARLEKDVEEVTREPIRTIFGQAVVGIAALVVTIFAADLMLEGALDVGERLTLAPAFLGVILGIGTSLPELATATASMRRGQSDLVIGNVLGSNLFNSLAVAGSAAVVRGGTLESLGAAPLWIMVGVAFVAGVMSRTSNRIDRREGILLLGVFVLFTLTVL